MRTHALLVLALLGACDCSEDGREPTAATVEVDLTPPPGRLVEICAGAERAALREALGPIAADLIPGDARETLREAAGEDASIDPAHLAAVRTDAPVCVLRLRSSGEGEDVTVAVAPMSRPIEGGEAAAPAGGRWLGDRAAVIGEALAVGPRQAIERAGAYAALALLPAERAEVLTVDVPEGVVPQRAAPAARELLSGWVSQGHGAIAAERRSHREPPALGDPERLLELLAGLGGEAADALSDLGAVHVSATLDGPTVRLRARAALREGSPFAERAGAWPEAPPRLEALPGGTAFAYFRAGLAEGEEPLAEHLAQIAGDRLTEPERAALARLTAGATGPRTIGVGSTPAGPFAFWRAEGDVAARREALGEAFAAGGWLATVADAASDCEGAGAQLGGGRARCEAGLVLGAPGEARLVVAAPTGHPRLASAGDAATAVARVAGRDPVVAALLVVPSAIPGALQLVRTLPAPAGRPDATGAALATLRVEEGALVLELRGAAEALRAVVALVGNE